jgi:hypothetical protein
MGAEVSEVIVADRCNRHGSDWNYNGLKMHVGRQKHADANPPNTQWWTFFKVRSKGDTPSASLVPYEQGDSFGVSTLNFLVQKGVEFDTFEIRIVQKTFNIQL